MTGSDITAARIKLDDAIGRGDSIGPSAQALAAIVTMTRANADLRIMEALLFGG